MRGEVRHDPSLDRRRLMGPHRTTASGTAAPQPTIRRPRTHPRSCRADGDSLRAADGTPLEHAAARDGLRLGYDLLAAPRALATGRRVEALAYGPAQRIAPTGPNRFGPRRSRQFVAPRVARGQKTGPNPTESRQDGSQNNGRTY